MGIVFSEMLVEPEVKLPSCGDSRSKTGKVPLLACSPEVPEDKPDFRFAFLLTKSSGFGAGGFREYVLEGGVAILPPSF